MAAAAAASAGLGSRQGLSRVTLVLGRIPQVVPFALRADMFLAMLDRERARHRMVGPMDDARGFNARIRRAYLYEDSLAAFSQMSNQLKGRLQIAFVNEQGLEEAGIDGGGVLKEFMDSICKRAFDPQYAFFLETARDSLLAPNPASHLAAADHLDHFVFLGRILGKAMFENILVEPQFAGCVRRATIASELARPCLSQLCRFPICRRLPSSLVACT